MINESENTDFGLMESFKSGDLSAFEEIIKKHKKVVYNIIYRFILDKTETEDLAQEVFLKVFKSKDTYRSEAKFSTWLYSIVHNACISYLRRKKIVNILSLDFLLDGRENEQSGAGDKNPVQISGDPDENPETNIISNEAKNLLEVTVKRALQKLPPKQRLAVILRHYNDLSYEEIAKSLNTSIQSVKSLLFRATCTLKKLLEI